MIRFNIILPVFCAVMNMLIGTVSYAQWTALNSGTTESLSEVFFVNEQLGWAVGNGSTLLKTTDGGASWQGGNAGVSANLHSVHFVDSNIGFIGAQYGIVLRTVNGGTSWDSLNVGQINFFGFAIFFTDANVGYVAGANFSGNKGQIYRTINGGLSWTLVKNTTGFTYSGIHFIGNTGYVTNSASGAYGVEKTTNSGVVWTYTSGFFFYHDTYFTSVDTGYIVGSSDYILKTTDGGANWNFAGMHNQGVGRDVSFPSDSIGYVVGNNGTISKTSDGGNSFCPQYSGTTWPLYSVCFVNDTTGYAVGLLGTILKTTNGGLSCPQIIQMAQNDTSICINESVTFSATTTGVVTYEWLKNGVSFSTLPTPTLNFSSISTDTIQLVVIDTCEGCANDTSNVVIVTVNPLPVITSSPDDTICVGDTAQLNASGGVSFSWIPTTGLNDSVISNPLASPGSTTTYFVTVTDSNECSAQDNVSIVVDSVYFIIDAPINICNGDSSMIYGIYQNATGSFSDSIISINGCDSVHTTLLTVNPTFLTPISLAICSGDSIFLEGSFQKTAGTYIDTLTTAITSCDSVIETTLTVNSNTTSTVTMVACDVIMWNGNNYSVSGTYLDTIPNTVGCDSMMTLVLTINNSTASSETTTACGSYTWNSNVYALSGTYVDTISNVKGCDSIMTLNLTINAEGSSSISISACDSYIWIGNTYNTTGTYTDSLTSIEGCDSIATLFLNINAIYNDSTTASICVGDSLTFGTQTLTIAGTYLGSFTTVNGCDSMVTLTLSEDALPVVTLSLNIDTICLSASSIQLAGGTPNGGLYLGPGLDSIGGGLFNPNDAGTGLHPISYKYTDGNGCADSALSEILVEVCLGNRIDPKEGFAIIIAPNPTTGIFRIHSQNQQVEKIKIYNMLGKLVYEADTYNSQIDLSDQQNGTYFVELWIQAKVIYRQQIVKK